MRTVKSKWKKIGGLGCIAGILSANLVVSAAPPENYDGMAMLDVEKIQINEGFLREPKFCYLLPNEMLTCKDAIERFVGVDNIQTNGMTGAEYRITAIKDSTEEDGWLSEGEYGSKSGWFIIMNNEVKKDIDSQVYDGDEIRIAYLKDGEASFNGVYVPLYYLAEFNSLEDKDLYLTLPDVKEAYNTLLSTITNPNSLETDITENNRRFRTIVRDSKIQIEVMKKELAIKKEEAKVELNTYKNPSDYLEEQKQELAAMVQSGGERIDTAKTIAEIENILQETKKAMDQIKTAAQIEQEKMKGDFNKDNKVDFSDLDIMLELLIKEAPIEQSIGDINNDLVVDFVDCDYLLQQLVLA